ncbi:WecB/TagA/CpsF family glycosyltransferase [Amorphus orientalis]|uniref:N-acetylglucosaminyldiphosphoundecaprenol N-acetyl-beta-D-mannosaminyltransferase n=1 Tax=Amorphus orientalis TaxID=649198 RepID=A0AAE4AVB1_9HYPH|nr:WecB/TagA/CpsF family glycosyltransferase [Amorphus orientalis]MDQ0316514.1 N-acetylglucosaminyldiphosphoundecaprenol N-acetyl-beta-D-mannosaminyltransferase [Amorphus orientalis]
MTARNQVRLFGIDLDVLDLRGAVERIMDFAGKRPARIVVTPNLDHLLKLQSDAAFHAAYLETDLVLADGMPLVWLSRLEATPLPERVAGSELIVPVCREAAARGRSVFFLGTTDAVLAEAEARLRQEIPEIKVAGRHAPGFGFREDDAAQKQAAEIVAASGADILFLALGAPTQEVFAVRYRDTIGCGVVLCIGAGLDFLAGRTSAAPVWMRRSGGEWIWRVLQEPARLAPRYGRILWRLPGLLGAHFSERRARRTGDPG